MEFKELSTYKDDETFIKKYESDTILNTKQIIQLLKNYIDENTKLYKCVVDTYTEEGNTYSPSFDSSNLDEIEELPNPSMSFHAFYIDPNTEKYKFEIRTDNNSKLVKYYVDKAVASIINDKIEKNKMLEEEKKSREINTDSNNKQY